MSASPVSPVFVGRHHELVTLHEFRANARAGEPTLVLVGGEAGVGKTRLINESERDARQAGFRVLTGQCLELGAEGLPFAPLVGALRGLARSTSEAELDELLGPARGGLARLVPELHSATSDSASVVQVQPSQLFELVLGVVERLGSTNPLLLVLEDIHWADRSTLELVAFLVRSLRDCAVLIIATYRSDEIHRRHPLRPLLAGWERVRNVRRIELPRFGRGDVSEQLAAVLGQPPGGELVDAVFERSDGNAFLIEELAGAIRSGGRPDQLPSSLREVLLTRADVLSSAAQRLLHTASAAGPWVSDRLLAEISGLDDASFYEALREAVEHHFLVVDNAGRGYAFRHALAQDAFYEDMLPGERVRLHSAFGARLSARPELAGDESLVPAALAHHWYAALDLPQALSASLAAARHASVAFAPAEAQRQLERVLELWDRVPDAETQAGADLVEVLRLAADAAYQAGELDRALSLIDQALTFLAAPLGSAETERRALLLERRANALLSAGRGTEAIPTLESALAELPEAPSRAQAAVLTSFAMTLLHNDGPTAARSVAERAVAAAAAVGAGQQEADALITLAMGLVYGGDEVAGLSAMRAGVSQALGLGASQVALRGFANLSDSLELLGQHDEAAEVARQGVALARQVGDLRTFGAFLTGNLAESLFRAGHWDEAARLLDDALERRPEGLFAGTLLEMRAELAFGLGRYDRAEADAHAAMAVVRHSGEGQFLQPLAYIFAAVAWAQGRAEDARQIIYDALAEADTWSARYSWPLLCLGAGIEATLVERARDQRLPPPPETEDRMAQLRGIAEDLPSWTPQAVAFRSTFAAESLRFDAQPVGAALVDAVRAWRIANEPPRLAAALVDLARAVCLERGVAAREEAEAALNEAFLLANGLAASPLIEDAEKLAMRARLNLPSTGDPSADTQTTSPLSRFGLTAREEEILELVAAGLSNPAIAERLYISPKTVSVHVTHLMAKLGVSGRVEAAALAHRLGVNSTQDRRR